MKTQIDLKSALGGLVVGVLAMLAIGASDSTSSHGRYQIAAVAGSNPNQAGFVIMVDTQTGKVWGADISKDWHPGGFWEAKEGK